jgi:DNA-binding NtrC family response regulator
MVWEEMKRDPGLIDGLRAPLEAAPERFVISIPCVSGDDRDPPTARGTHTVSDLGEDEPEAAAQWARLCVVAPRELRGVHALLEPRGGGAVVLGREPGPAGLPLAHATVSRRHLELRASPGQRATFVAVDLGSHNGSWHNGVPVGAVPRPLASGDVLRLGQVVAVFEQGQGAGLDALDRGPVSREAVVGVSAGAIALRHAIARAAADPSPVLVIGPSGSGKESVAAEIHRLSGRPGPLVIANCATLTSSLADSQLFGHERGAFTGAVRAQPGLFRSAEGGSLFLDEIGELPLLLQPKLLRAVERGEVVPLGDTRTLTVDVRIIAATHRELADEVERGAFRRDLYARLSLLRVRVPPLAERRADLLAWLDVLHERWQSTRGGAPGPSLELSAEAVEALLLHPWPENLRGLDHLVRELAGVGSGKVTRARLPAWVQPAEGLTEVSLSSSPAPAPAEPQPRPAKPSREELLAVLEAQRWNLRAVARHYGRDRRQIYRWLEGYGIELRR